MAADFATEPLVIVLLGVVGLIAGFVDAIAGGGGLLTLPSLLLAGLPPHLALGTSKGQAVFGSGVSLLRFYHSPLLDRHRAWTSFATGFVGSAIGVALVWMVPATALRPLVTALLLAVAIFMLVYRPKAAPDFIVRRPLWLAGIVGLIMGFYDGFFGPGTGTILIMIYLLGWRDRLDAASANAKVPNFASNLAAVIMFAWVGLVAWPISLSMGLGQAIGGWLGAHVTIRRGQRLVRIFVVCISIALVARLVWQMLEG